MSSQKTPGMIDEKEEDFDSSISIESNMKMKTKQLHVGDHVDKIKPRLLLDWIDESDSDH